MSHDVNFEWHRLLLPLLQESCDVSTQNKQAHQSGAENQI